MHEDKKAEDSSAGNAEGYEIFESLRHPVCAIGTDGTLLYMNSIYRELFQADTGEVRLNWDHPLYPEYRRRVAQAYLNALGGSERQCFAVIKTPDDRQMITEIHLFPMFRDNQVRSILASFRIITDRLLSFDRSTLSLISEDNFQYDTLHFEFSPIPLLRLNTGCEITRCSRSMEGFIGYGSEDIIEKKLMTTESLFIFDGEKVLKTCSQILQGEIPFKRIGEVKIHSRSDEVKIANITLYPLVQNNEITAVEMAFEDITKLIELRQQLSAQSSVELFMDITKGFLHSLNNSINVIMSRTQLLLQITEKESVTRGIQMIEESSLDIVKQIRRVQDFISTREEDREETEPLVNVIEDAIEFSRMRFKVEDTERRRNIIIEKRYFTSVHVKTDTRLLREIIVSIILRVSTFIGKKGTIQIQLKENHDIALSIRAPKDPMGDHGQALSDTVNVFSGNDIRKVAERINLKIIEEESQEYYSLRAVFPARMIIITAQAETGETDCKIRDMDILVAEDEVALQRVLYELFDRMGNRVFVCSNGTEALTEFKRKRYDAVITDYDIGGITGIELSARVKEINEKTLTVLLSGWMLSNMAAYKNVVDLFLPKPFKLDELLKRMSRIIRERKK